MQEKRSWTFSMRYSKRFTELLCRKVYTARLSFRTLYRAVRCLMQLPNKALFYKNSTLALMPIVLRVLQNGAIDAKTLHLKVRPSLEDATDFLCVMDCLYALGAVDMTDEGGRYIHACRIVLSCIQRTRTDSFQNGIQKWPECCPWQGRR